MPLVVEPVEVRVTVDESLPLGTDTTCHLPGYTLTAVSP